MPYRKPTNWITLAIILASCAVAVFGIVTYRNIVTLRQGETRVAHAYAIREAIRGLFSSIKDMESGERGYLLTGDESYLASYHDGLTNVEEEFAVLRKLTSDDSIQQDRLDELFQLFTQKRALLAEAIQLRIKSPRPTVPAEALQVVASGRGTEVMKKMRDLVEEILKRQNRVLAEREEAAETRVTASETYIVAGNVLALALFLLTGIVAHIDRRKRDRAEAHMRASEAEFAAIFNTAHDGIIMFSEDLRVRLMNPAAAKLYRCDAESEIGESLLKFIPRRLQEVVADDIRDFLESDDTMRRFGDRYALRGDGSEFPCEGSSTKTVVGGKRFATMRFRDLTEAKASRAKIREQTVILNQVRDAILVSDMDDRIIFWNRGSELLYGLPAEQAIGQIATELLFANQHGSWEEGRRSVLEKGVYSAEVPLVSKDGREIVIEQRRSLIRDEGGQPAAQLIISLDITARKQAEAKARRSQRLESIGTLAGGIAHDLNNVLTPILMSAKMIKRGGSNTERLANTIVTSTERGAQMIRKLLAFAGGEQGTRERIELREILLEADEILSHTLPKTIDLRVACGDDLHAVTGDATELSQVLMNLAINARDAMPEGGRLELEAKNCHVDPARAARSDTLQAGPHVLLTVTDTGSGIPPNIIERIFDPFFTTKEQGKGTGLGLSTTLGIVRSHGGDVTVYSEPGQGSSFAIYLPSAAMGEASSVQASGEEVASGGSETILLADDEPLILETARATLEAVGYRVASAKSGAEALAVYQHQSDSIDLVLLDMMMPGMDGFAAKDALRAINPRVRIIASSGLRRPGADGGRLDDVDGFLPKPYSDEQLLRIVRKVLDAAVTITQERA
ncbi:MAG: CHASE3 domain-containing protein [Planctomycetota bacterium]